MKEVPVPSLKCKDCPEYQRVTQELGTLSKATGLDGYQRNIVKLREERLKVVAALDEVLSAKNDQPWRILHNYWVNGWVEAQRASPYYMGHIDAVMYPVLVGCLLLMWWF